ncbi:transmembrane protein 41a [Pseudohyphozyma bogoriensis]|nr:transmembrane protein 41a [Pseudohyphozyma bogoriensis]
MASTPRTSTPPPGRSRTSSDAAMGGTHSSPLGAPPKQAALHHQPADADLVARPSAVSLRPLLATKSSQTRIRARSVTSGSGSSAPTLVAHLSPTLAGSPVLPSNLLRGGSFDAELRPTDEGRSPDGDETVTTPTETSLGGDTVRIVGDDGAVRGFDDWTSRPRQEVLDLRAVEMLTRSRSGSDGARRAKGQQGKLEETTRINLRRGRSFTSLLMLPTDSPTKEREDPILEETTPPLSSATSDEEAAVFPPTPHSPTLASAPSAATAAPIVKPTLGTFAPQLGFLAFLFLASFAIILLLIGTLPNLFIPHSLSDLPSLTSNLTTYRTTSFIAEIHLFLVLSALFVWKQAFSIPGSILTNILFGALYGTTFGTVSACVWTAVGSMGAYGIARVVSPLVEYYFATPLGVTRRALGLVAPSTTSPAQVQPVTSSSSLFEHLLLARLFPLLPYSVLNIISGVLSIPLLPFFTTLVLGSFPFNFATVSVGSLVSLSLSSDAPLDRIWSTDVILKLVLVTLISVLPLVFKERLKRLLSGKGLGSVVTWLRTFFVGGGEGRANEGYVQLRANLRSGGERRKWNKSWAPGDWNPGLGLGGGLSLRDEMELAEA